MAELSNVEKILVEKYGWSDNGDGTLTNPYGGLYDTEQGGSIAAQPAAQQTTQTIATQEEAAPAEPKVTAAEQLAQDLGITEEGTSSSKGWLGDLKNEVYNAIQSGKTLDPTNWGVRGGRSDYSVQLGDTALSLGRLVQYDDEGERIQAVMDTIAKYNMIKSEEDKAAKEEQDKVELVDATIEAPVVEEEVTPTDDLTKTFPQGTTDGGTVETVGIPAEEAKGAFPTAGGGFESVIPSTEVVDLGAGEAPVVDPNIPRTVVQDVAPVTYGDTTTTTPTPVSSTPTPEVMQTSITSPTTDYKPGYAAPQVAVPGTYTQPLQTAGLSAVPQQVTYKTHYAGTPGAVPKTLVTTAPGTGEQYTTGYQLVYYYNKFFPQQRIPVTEFNGKPTTYVPPNFVREGPQPVAQQQQTQANPFVDPDAPDYVKVMAARGAYINGYADGGDTTNKALLAVAKLNGYKGTEDSRSVRAFMNSSEGLRAKARAVGVAMNKGGAVLYAQDGVDVQPGTTTDPTFAQDLSGMTQSLIGQTMQPIQAPTAMLQPTSAEFIPVDAGQATPIAPYAEAATVGDVSLSGTPVMATPATAGVTTVAPSVQATTEGMTTVQGELSDQAQVAAAQQLTTSVSGMESAQGTAIKVDSPEARKLQTDPVTGESEIISGVANAQTAANFNEAIQAAEATPTKQATVQGQLEGLMQQFEGGNTPAWAAGSMRTAMATLAARGLGASSMAGQAVIQATMEAALPIAQMDAQTQAQFESQNLSNRQQRAMLAAQQRAQFLGMEFDQAFQARVANSARIGDIANMNFTAEQNIALENSRAANTMELNNLSNRQAMVLAEAAALSNLDMANLSNRQQAAVQNAQNFLQMDMANLSNEQQTAMFKAQQNIQALFTDQAAENAAAQFNASSENQTNQFFANLSSQTSQFNASQQNAMNQFNVNSVNALREFNSELQQQRDLFNAQNGLVIAQANAQWRQNIATINTATQNQSNMDFAKTMNALSSTNLDAYWQRERDIMSFAFTSAENAADRLAATLLEKLSAENKASLADEMGKGSLVATLLKGGLNYMATGGSGNIV